MAYSYLSNWSGKEDKLENYLWVCCKVASTDNRIKLTISQTNYDEERAKHSEENWASLIDGMKNLIE